jgi:hypothetical protein
LFGNGKKKKTRRRRSCTTKLLVTKSTRVIEKIVELCHTTKNRLLAKQLPLSWEEVAGPSLVGSSSPIISWFAPMYQTNVVASSFLSPQAITQAAIAAKTQQQEE